MKIAEPKWSPYSDALNQEALDNPQPGDYWSERMCPYFLVVDVQGGLYTILCCFPNGNTQMARIIGKDSWQFDYTKHSVVTAEWIKKNVCYNTAPGFVADVVRGREKRMQMVAEWQEVNPNYVPSITPPPYKQYAEWWLGS
jgi:hypothetical protein